MNIEDVKAEAQENVKAVQKEATDLISEAMDRIVKSELIKKILVVMSNRPETSKEQLKDLMESVADAITKSKLTENRFRSAVDSAAYKASAQWWMERCILEEHVYKDAIDTLAKKFSQFHEKGFCSECGFCDETCRGSCELGIKEWASKEYRKRLEAKGFSEEDLKSPQSAINISVNFEEQQPSV